MCSVNILLVSSFLILSMLYRLATELNNSTCYVDLLFLYLDEVLIVLSHIEQ